MGNPIVRYTQRQYQAKIDSLEGCAGNLQRQLTTLEGLKSQVPSFWDDPQAPDYLKRLTTAIVGVRNAMSRTNDTIAEYKSIITEMHGVTDVTTGLIDDISGVIGSLGIKE